MDSTVTMDSTSLCINAMASCICTQAPGHVLACSTSAHPNTAVVMCYLQLCTVLYCAHHPTAVACTRVIRLEGRANAADAAVTAFSSLSSRKLDAFSAHRNSSALSRPLQRTGQSRTTLSRCPGTPVVLLPCNLHRRSMRWPCRVCWPCGCWVGLLGPPN